MNSSSEIYSQSLCGIKTTNLLSFSFPSSSFFFLCVEIAQFGMLPKYPTFTPLKMI